MRKTQKKKVMKGKFYICRGFGVVAKFLQGGVKLTPPPPPVNVGLILIYLHYITSTAMAMWVKYQRICQYWNIIAYQTEMCEEIADPFEHGFMMNVVHS